MNSDPNKSTYNDRSLILMLIGIPVMLISIMAAVYGPSEIYPLNRNGHLASDACSALSFDNVLWFTPAVDECCNRCQ